MMSWLKCKLVAKHTLAATVGALSTHLRIRREGCIVLCYHDIVGDMPILNYDTVCSVVLERFESQILFLKDQGFSFVSLSDLAESLERKVVPTRTILITFDDGKKSFLDRAMPILQKHSIPCAVFLITGLIGSSAEWLTWSDICALDSSEMVEFGAHTVSHPKLTDCCWEEIKREVNNSKTTIEEHLGHRIAAFAYPYGRHNREVVNAMRRAGFTTSFTTRYGAANGMTDPFRIPRITICVDDTLKTFGRKLAGAYDWL
ncbi:MAG: polysaccharide deacetylase family protein [Firmicutes bacterium]|nr:polysaccharide deacetylase family protein [Bacillota bacterium]